MLALFAVGTMLFWVVLFFFLLLEIIFVETSMNFMSTFWVVLFFVFLGFFGHFNILVFALTHPFYLLSFIVLYVFIGIIWSLFKWHFYIKGRVERNDYRTLKNSTELPFDLSSKCHKAKIMNWLAYWPFSFIWACINQPIRKFYNWLYSYLTTTYQNVSMNIYNNAVKK